MAQSLRRIKSRIKSVENTGKMARAMEMISVSKLKRAQYIHTKTGIYSVKVEELLKNILSTGFGASNPFMTPRPDAKKIALCIITSDTGLCGSYNHNIIRSAQGLLKKYDQENIKIIAVGKKGFIYFNKKGFKVTDSYVGLSGRFSQAIANKLSDTLINIFLSDPETEVYIAYTCVQTAARHKPLVEKFLNIAPPDKACAQIEYIYETAPQIILERLLPVYLSNKMRSVLLNSFVSEHQARSIAMGEATKNALDLLSSLVLTRDKMRQYNITTEILEVISSADALKG